jgi:hypothetical protein
MRGNLVLARLLGCTHTHTHTHTVMIIRESFEITLKIFIVSIDTCRHDVKARNYEIGAMA